MFRFTKKKFKNINPLILEEPVQGSRLPLVDAEVVYRCHLQIRWSTLPGVESADPEVGQLLGLRASRRAHCHQPTTHVPPLPSMPVLPHMCSVTQTFLVAHVREGHTGWSQHHCSWQPWWHLVMAGDPPVTSKKFPPSPPMLPEIASQELATGLDSRWRSPLKPGTGPKLHLTKCPILHIRQSLAFVMGQPALGWQSLPLPPEESEDSGSTPKESPPEQLCPEAGPRENTS